MPQIEIRPKIGIEEEFCTIDSKIQEILKNEQMDMYFQIRSNRIIYQNPDETTVEHRKDSKERVHIICFEDFGTNEKRYIRIFQKLEKLKEEFS